MIIFGSVAILVALFHVAQSSVLMRKEPICANLIEGQPCAIHYELYNLEAEALTNIHFNDDYGMKLGALAEVVGKTSVKVAKLASGGHFFHAVVITPKDYVHGEQLFDLVTRPVAVQYRLNGEERMTISTSSRNTTTIQPFVFSQKVFSRQFGPTIQIWTSFGLIVGAPTLMAFLLRNRLDRQYPMSAPKSL